MNELFEQLGQINDILDQITNITTNQMTVLLQSISGDVDEGLNMLEGMVSYKDELISELIAIEALFDKGYKEKRDEVNTSNQVDKLKQYVKMILEKKERIKQLENNNMTIMQSKVRENKKMQIKKVAQEVAAAYKKQQSQS